MTTEVIRGSAAYGSRYATRVRVSSPQGSSFDGRHGTVVEVLGETVMVRLQVGEWHHVVLPFGRHEVQVVS